MKGSLLSIKKRKETMTLLSFMEKHADAFSEYCYISYSDFERLLHNAGVKKLNNVPSYREA